MIQRGIVYDVYDTHTESIKQAVVVTVDRWNATMSTVGVIFVGPPEDPDTLWTPILAAPEPMQVTVGHLVIVRGGAVQNPRARLPAAALDQIANGLRDVMAFPHVHGSPPQAPPAGPGGVYPRWSQVYYLTGETREHGRLPEPKRFLVVSTDEWNEGNDYVLAVRLTSQRKNPPAAFPNVSRGASRACCGDLPAIRATQLSRGRRPDVQFLPLADMARVAHGLTVTHEL